MGAATPTRVQLGGYLQRLFDGLRQTTLADSGAASHERMYDGLTTLRGRISFDELLQGRVHERQIGIHAFDLEL